MSETPAGWYPNPENPYQQRYWDGTQWTANFAPLAMQSAVPAVTIINTNTNVAGGYGFWRFRSSPVVVVIAWIITLLTGGLMLPWAIAATRNLRNHVLICVLTVILAFTIIGWFIPLFMSLRGKHPDEA